MQHSATFQDPPSLSLTEDQERAVLLLVDGKESREQIAALLGIDRTTLYRWERDNQDFKRRLAQRREQLQNEMGVSTLTDKLHRLRHRDARWRKNTALIEARAKKYANSNDPDCGLELATGMYKKKVSRRYSQGQLVSEEIEPIFDSGLYRALHDDELLTTKEMGDLITRNEVSGPGGGPIQMQHEVKVVGFALGGIEDALDWLLRIRDAGRLPTTDEECIDMITEIEAREKAARMGKPVPPLSEPYIPMLDKLLSDPDEGK